MRIKLFPLFWGLLSILSASCTKEVKYTKEELLAQASAGEASFKVVVPKGLGSNFPKCTDYSSGCMFVHMVSVKDVEFIAIEFQTQDDAIYAAKKFRGYYLRNWMLDDVTGEPVLEEFVEKVLKAQKP